MKKTSTILYTLEDKNGSAESFTSLESVLTGNEKIVTVELKGENMSLEVPLLEGYEEPFDFDVTDEIGTEHYIFYKELDS